jgi:prophage regulatory protein
MEKILRRPAVQEITSLPTSTLYSKMADGTFPKPLKLGKRSVGWRESEVRAWLEGCKDTSAA